MFLIDSQDFSIPMALIDLIPVILFFISGVILLNDLYNKLVKGNYAMLATGVCMIFLAGVLKAIHKILAGAGFIDFVVLNKCFFPMQGFGFILLGTSLLGMFYEKKESVQIKSSILLIYLLLLTELKEYTGSIPFIIIQVLGASVFYFMLGYISIEMKTNTSLIFIIISFITMLLMGYLTSKFNNYELAKWNWIAEIVNIISQITLLLSVYILHKKGLANVELKKRGKKE